MHKKGYEETVLGEIKTKRTERKRATVRILKAALKFYMKETGTDAKMGFGVLLLDNNDISIAMKSLEISVA